MEGFGGPAGDFIDCVVCNGVEMFWFGPVAKGGEQDCCSEAADCIGLCDQLGELGLF